LAGESQDGGGADVECIDCLGRCDEELVQVN
jgi:hypothetical protein